MKSRRPWLAAALAACLAIIALIAFGWGPSVLRNQHVFADGEGFRTARLTPAAMRDVIADRHIRSVLCLMGEPDDLPWFDEEKSLCEELGVEFRSFEASQSELPSVRLIRSIVGSWESLPHPTLVHCRRGADRTGLAVTMIELLRGASLDEALDQLTWKRLHICGPSCQLHRFFSLYRDYLSGQPAEHSAALFRRWCLQRYYPPPYARSIEVLQFPDSVWPGQPCIGRVRVTNTSSEPWVTRADSEPGIRFGGRVLGPLEKVPHGGDSLMEGFFHENRFQAGEDFRTTFGDGRWMPGETRELTCAFTAGERPGLYLYRLDMVDENVDWFCVRSTPATYRVLTVVDADLACTPSPDDPPDRTGRSANDRPGETSPAVLGAGPRF